LLDFDAGLELRAGRNKGGAVEAILAESDSGGPVAYLGDDLSDEAAFSAVNAIGPRGLSVLVRRKYRETDAQIWLRPPADLVEFLVRWIRAVSG
jgi:trehalose-phosphatase